MVKPPRRTFTVEGSGSFPIDMLRYDACWPQSERYDTPAIQQDPFSEPKKRRRVVLVTDNPSAPTVGRWESFTWKVVARCELRETEEAAHG
jgi:hypothetical protein